MCWWNLLICGYDKDTCIKNSVTENPLFKSQQLKSFIEFD